MAEETKKKTVVIHLPHINIWMVTTLILAIALVVLYLRGGSITGMFVGLTSQQAANKAIDYINKNLVQTGTASLVSVEEMSGVYKVTTSYQGQNIPIYVTKDGLYLFVSQPINMEEEAITTTTQREEEPSITQVSVDDDPMKGSKDAPVTIIEFSDFQCPYCARFFEQTLPQIEENYIKTGKVKFVYRDFPLSFHQYAQKAAEASECADEQGKFWEYHDKLFENQNALDAASLKQYAKDLGLDVAKFNECLDSSKMASEVQKDVSDGSEYGVTGTPAFFINGVSIEGAQPYSAFEQVIEGELNK